MTHYVDIVDFAFVPDAILIAVGDSVVWTNRDGVPHSARRIAAPQINTGLLGEGEPSAPQAFDEPTGPEGIEYFCGPHPHMTARITVSA